MSLPARKPARSQDLLTAAFEHESILRALLYRYTRNNEDVKELLQEVYVRVITYRCQPTNLQAFLMSLARNVAIDLLRHKQVVPIELLADIDKLERLDDTALIDELISSQQELSLLVEAACQLPPKRRQVFLLRKIYGYSHAEIGQRLKIAEHTVECHLQYAVRDLALILGSRLP